MGAIDTLSGEIIPGYSIVRFLMIALPISRREMLCAALDSAISLLYTGWTCSMA